MQIQEINNIDPILLLRINLMNQTSKDYELKSKDSIPATLHDILPK